MTFANSLNFQNHWMPFTANRQFKKALRHIASHLERHRLGAYGWFAAPG